MAETKFEELVGKTLTKLETGDETRFYCSDGAEYIMYHPQDCCELVELIEVVGNPDDLIGSPITMAEEATNSDDPPPDSGSDESYTWTFYKLATVKGYVTLRWFGTSNGFYSEEVYFGRVKE